ncbi:unknown protein [Cronobacter turicensis z3032]|uniref:Uncharacterized protein n=1 Tax=Cronobacter turicensis (strain DSM 18703 / CCUG 55852 / LMG 23827 / z3032) TaxID=693216 RepID=C9Y4D1_CROTZ|nr:unknown protein [Cronobacter turicensis z3032]
MRSAYPRYVRRQQMLKVSRSVAERAKAINPRIQSELVASSGHAPLMDEAARFNAQPEEFADNAVARVSRAHLRKAM